MGIPLRTFHSKHSSHVRKFLFFDRIVRHVSSDQPRCFGKNRRTVRVPFVGVLQVPPTGIGRILRPSDRFSTRVVPESENDRKKGPKNARLRVFAYRMSSERRKRRYGAIGRFSVFFGSKRRFGRHRQRVHGFHPVIFEVP